jgi:hypothetical protein
MKGQKRTCEIPASKFEGMSWLTPELGGPAMLYPVKYAREQLRFRIQSSSKDRLTPI